MSYTSVVVFYNPKSTGPGKDNAMAFKDSIEEKFNVKIIETKYAGHGEELAEEYTRSKSKILLVSSSGDGGYHDMINGVMKGTGRSSNVVVSLLPSGNANDHYNAVKSSDYITNIVEKNTRSMDLIQITSVIDGEEWIRYAHSYVGFGVSAHIGKQLTPTKLNLVNEKIIALKGLWQFQYFRIRRNNKSVKYNSLIFSNIDTMSKVLTLADTSRIDDGKIELNQIPHRNVFTTIVHFFIMLFTRRHTYQSISEYEFDTTHKTAVQLDGEHYVLDANSSVKINVMKKAITFVS